MARSVEAGRGESHKLSLFPLESSHLVTDRNELSGNLGASLQVTSGHVSGCVGTVTRGPVRAKMP